MTTEGTTATTVATPTPVWLQALDSSSRRLEALVADLPEKELSQRSFASEWTIAQVLSHLGSAAEICTVLVRRAIAGDTTGPAMEDVRPVWRRWDALAGPAQRDAWRAADTAHRELLSSLSFTEHASLRVPYFSGLLGVADYAGYRLSEQSVHGWDIAVTLDPAARIPAGELALLWERLDLVVSRFHDSGTLTRLGPGQIAVELSGPDRTLRLSLNTELHLHSGAPTQPNATVCGQAEAVLRLVYGRNRSGDGVEVAGAASLDDLRALFPGY
jgi:uncharacterized protein (TIGR03083 family)